MSVRPENVNNESKQSDAEEVSTNDNRISSEFKRNEERNKMKLEPVNEQMSNLTQLLNKMIQVS